jgi:hypothetical protein
MCFAGGTYAAELCRDVPRNAQLSRAYISVMFYLCTLHRPLSAQNTQFPLVAVLRITNPCDEEITVRMSRAQASLVNSTATAAATSAYAAAVTMPHSSSSEHGNSDDVSVDVSVEVQLQAVEDEYLSSLGDTPPALPPDKLLAALQMSSSTDSSSDNSSSSDTSTLLEVLHVQGNSAWLRVQLPLQLWYDGFEVDSSAVYDAAAAVNLELAVTDDSSGSSSSSSSTLYRVEVVLPVSAYT